MARGHHGRVPLAMAETGHSLRLVDIEGGRGLRGRLTAMGFSPGCFMRVARNCGGPVVVELDGSRMMVGRGMAERIFVRDVDHCPARGIPRRD